MLIDEILSPREREVALLVASGKGRPEIARQLNLSPFTVRNHLDSIYKKLGLSGKPSPMIRLVAIVYGDRYGA